ncbi:MULTISPECIES: caspase family protein [unclassified Coleofasciculus]|uniref:caspase family protein n=1 Tax=unclassified Coleofasciculus TaxID=2692782 RepID=UPI001882C792|nr:MULTISPECIES: caspase family protein [unclassified Coleofasciculus]MBE9127172.1 caspase family protein [Coleofasciculus sp. LEGE 07081]MBE9150493.1 caspase family protein [Coleofasciculus sp. LEGE 07092]
MKAALLIGVSEYGYGFHPLPEAVKNVEAMQRVLQHPGMGDFNKVQSLLNPNPPVMRDAIETLFSGRTEKDLVLLFFSGHCVKDNKEHIYLGTGITATRPSSNDGKKELVKATAIPLNFVWDIMSKSLCNQQVAVLDCHFNTVSARTIKAGDEDILDLKTQLGDKRQTFLISAISTEKSLELESSQPSAYTRSLVEGIETGAADLNGDGWISIEELHNYACSNLKKAHPALTPSLYGINATPTILLARVHTNEPKQIYRQQVEYWTASGEIASEGRSSLDTLARNLHLTAQDCTSIEAEVLKPYQEYQEKLQKYKHAFATAIAKDYPIEAYEELRDLKQSLGLTDEDAAQIETTVQAARATEKPVPSSISTSVSEQESPTPISSQQQAKAIAPPTAFPPAPDFPPTPISSQQQTKAIAPPVTPQPQESTISTGDTVPAREKQVPPQPIPHAASADLADEQTPTDNSESNGIPPTPNPVPSWYLQTPTAQPTNPLTTNSSANLKDTQPSAFPYKSVLFVGIGSGLATLALILGISNLAPVAPPTDSAERVSSSPEPASTPSPAGTDSETIGESESQSCLVIVSGNVRSDPASFRENVVTSFSRMQLPVTGRQTKGGWIEVKLPDNRTAWAHREIILDDEELDSCLFSNGDTIEIVPDIPPPEPSPSPSLSQ